jgi:rod shape-determining protein MreC
MNSILVSRTARRRGIAFTILLAVSLLLMAFSSNPFVLDAQRGLRFAFRPIQSVLDEAASGVTSLIGAIAEIDRLRLENGVLTEENDRLEALNARLDALRRENEQLTALLQLQSGFEFETVAARIVGRESSEFSRLVTIDAGSDVGVALGDVVVTAGGALAGRIAEVGPNYARILLLSDPATTVVGELVGTGATGEVVGRLGLALEMSKIDATESVNVGQEVVTAGIVLGEGIRSPYPKGLVIGQVVQVDRDPNAVIQTAFLMPAADLTHLSYVLIILDYEGSLPSLGEEPIDCTPTDDGTLPGGEQPCATPTPAPTPESSPPPGGSPSPVPGGGP